MTKKGLQANTQYEQAEQNNQKKDIKVGVNRVKVDVEGLKFEYSYEGLRRLVLSFGFTLAVLATIILTILRLIFG